MKEKVLVLFSHTYFNESRLNKTLLSAISELNNVTIHDLSISYPDFKIDVKKEQELLREHQHIVFQFPFFWYSVPAIQKHWFDEVLTFGFAYGEGGDKLKDKTFATAITTGGGPEAYSPTGYNRFNINDLLLPLVQTSHLCGMKWHKPFLVQGARVIDDDQLTQKASEYQQFLFALSK